MSSAIQIHAGKTAFAHLEKHGLQAQDVAVIPAAAGGPKGLILQGIDQWLFGEWLPAAPRERSLIGEAEQPFCADTKNSAGDQAGAYVCGLK